MFGGFYSVAVTEQWYCFFDANIFVFSFESQGRCATPQRFAVKEGLKKEAGVKVWKNNVNGFVFFGVYNAGGFWLGNERSNSHCLDLSQGFEGIEDTTLTGTNDRWSRPYHPCTRLVAVHLE